MPLLFAFARKISKKEASAGKGGVARKQHTTKRSRSAVPERTPTFSRNGHHVLVGGPGAVLRRNFVSSHQAKKVEAR